VAEVEAAEVEAEGAEGALAALLLRTGTGAAVLGAFLSLSILSYWWVTIGLTENPSVSVDKNLGFEKDSRSSAALGALGPVGSLSIGTSSTTLSVSLSLSACVHFDSTASGAPVAPVPSVLLSSGEAGAGGAEGASDGPLAAGRLLVCCRAPSLASESLSSGRNCIPLELRRA
jgi:hypothetical protein